MDWLLLSLASRMICWQQATPVVQMESLEVPPAVARPDLSACALPHKNLPFSASSISYPPILSWSLLQDCIFVHQLRSRRGTRYSLESKRKVFHEASREVCRLTTPIACCIVPEEGSVEKSLSYQARREVLQQVAPQYREASSSQKRTLLDAFVATTGYHRTYARWLLNHAEEVQQSHGTHSRTSMDRTSNMHSFWPGTPPTASAPNGSSLFSPRWSKRWSGMSICSLLRSAASNSFP